MDSFEEYKLFCELTQRLSERRQTASQTYLAVNTAIFGVLALLVNNAGFRGWALVTVSAPLYLVGIVSCLIWLSIIASFRRIIGGRYEQLRDMEQALPGCRQVYSKEWKAHYDTSNGKEGFAFSNLEAWLPRLLIAVYAIYGIGLAIATALEWL